MKKYQKKLYLSSDVMDELSRQSKIMRWSQSDVADQLLRKSLHQNKESAKKIAELVSARGAK